MFLTKEESKRNKESQRMREGTKTHTEASIKSMFSSILNCVFAQSRQNRNLFLLVPLGAIMVKGE